MLNFCDNAGSAWFPVAISAILAAMKLTGPLTDTIRAPMLNPGGFAAAPSVMHGFNCACENCAVPNAAENESPNPQSAYDKNKLRIAGGLNFIGDVGLLIDGIKNKDPLTQVAGWLYTVGAGIATLFGTAGKERQLRDLHERTAEFLHNHASNKDRNLLSSQTLQNRKTGVMANLDRGLRRHAGQTMLGFYLAGAVAMLFNGIRKLKRDTAAGRDLNDARATIGYGIVSILVKAVSFFTKEDSAKNKTVEKTAKPASGFIGWLKEKPMRIFGYGSLVTESMLAWRTYGKYKKREAGEDFRWAALTTGSYMASDVIIAGANKDAANAVKLDAADRQKLESMAAETIAAQAESERAPLIEKTAEFLASQPQVGGNTEQVRQSLTEKIKQMSGKLWADRAADRPPAPALAHAR